MQSIYLEEVWILKVNLIIPDKNKKIIVYCGLDLRSPLATKLLNDLGYKKAVNMIGGLKAWKEKGYPDMGHCSEDVLKFCKDVKQARQWICLQEHENDLSAVCKEQIAKRTEEGMEDLKKKRQFRIACEDDIAEFCERVRPRGYAVQQCLKKHESELSDPCREQIKQESVQQLMFNGKYW